MGCLGALGGRGAVDGRRCCCPQLAAAAAAAAAACCSPSPHLLPCRPFKPINTSLYLCDNKFHTEALNELLEADNK